MTVLKGRKFCTTIDEQIVFSQLEYSESAVWSLFLASGYLKADSYRFNEEFGIEEYELNTANIARLMFEMYAEPSTSFGDIARYFAENNILIYGKELNRGFISQFLRSPIYAQADLELYEFFKGQGAVVVNDAAGFAGTNGCYLYQGRAVIFYWLSPTTSWDGAIRLSFPEYASFLLRALLPPQLQVQSRYSIIPSIFV